jgi:hypothetical protein
MKAGPSGSAIRSLIPSHRAGRWDGERYLAVNIALQSPGLVEVSCGSKSIKIVGPLKLSIGPCDMVHAGSETPSERGCELCATPGVGPRTVA